MSTYSNNTTLKVQAAIGASLTGNGTLYTCPANSYAIVNFTNVGGTSGFQLLLDSKVVFTGFMSSPSAVEGSRPVQIYVGPGQSLVTSGGGGQNAHVTGVEFKNSP